MKRQPFIGREKYRGELWNVPIPMPEPIEKQHYRQES